MGSFLVKCLNFYRPQNEVSGKVMFLHLSVILFLGGGVHPPRQTPPPETATAADGTHPTGMHSFLIFFFC